MHVGPQGPWHSFGRACDPALTYHLVPPELFARLWEVQKQPESGGGFVTNADLFHLVFDNKSQELIDLEGGLEMDTNRGGFDFLELSRASHKMAEQEFDRKSIEELDMLLKSDFKLPWLTAKLLKKLDPIMEKITKETHVKKKAALALRCLAACQALDRVMDIPQVGKDEPIAMFHNRTAGTQNPLGNKSTKFGPCVMWSLNLADRCYLKSGLGQAPIGGAEGHWSGIVEGAYERYASLGRNQAAGERCGWAENRGEGWDRKK